MEKYRKVRIDCNCVESNIHPPTGSSLLWDAGVIIPDFHNHRRVDKRRMLAILNVKRKKQRKAAYTEKIGAILNMVAKSV